MTITIKKKPTNYCHEERQKETITISRVTITTADRVRYGGDDYHCDDSDDNEDGDGNDGHETCWSRS